MSHDNGSARRSPQSNESHASAWSRLLVSFGLFLSVQVSATVYANEPDDLHCADAAATARHLFHREPGDGWPDGWTLSKAGVLSEFCGASVFRFDSLKDQGSYEVIAWLTEEASPCACRTRNYCLQFREAGRPDVLSAQEAPEPLARAVCTEAAFRDRGAITPDGPRNAVYRVFLVLLAGCVLFGTFAILIREVRRSDAPRWVGPVLGLVVVLAGLLRLFGSWGFIHEYFHAGGMTAAYLHDDLLDHHGEVAPALYRAMQAVTGGDENAIFGTNALLGTMTVPVLAMLDLMLFGSWIRAVFSAFVLAVLPHHLRLSGTEDFFVAAVLFSVCGLAMGVRFLRTGSRATLSLAVGGLFLAMQSRPEAALTPVFLGVLVLMGAGHGWWRVFARPATWVGVAGLGALVAMQRTWFPTGAEMLLPDITLLRWPWPQLYLNTNVTPMILSALGVIGLITAAYHRDPVAAWPFLAAEASVYASLIGFDSATYNLRAQLIAAPYFILLSGGGLMVLLQRVTVPPARIVVVGLVLFSVLEGFATRWVVVTEDTPDQDVYDFVAETVPDLPDGPGFSLLVPTTFGSFPTERVWRERKWLRVVSFERFVGRKEPGVGCSNLIVFEGPGCFLAPTPLVTASTMDSRCLEVRRICRLEPFRTKTIKTSETYGLMRHGGGEPSAVIGFYRAHERSMDSARETPK